jgi:hypothetical protein
MSAPEYDPEFEAYLRRRVRFDRRLPRSLTRLEPPAELDRIVIGMAREAIQPSPTVPLFRAPKWAAPLAMAASLLVSFALMLDVGLRQAVHHDALRTPMLVDIAPDAPAGSNYSALVAPIAAAPAPRVSLAARVVHPKAQRARSANEDAARRADTSASTRAAPANAAQAATDASQTATMSVSVTASAVTAADIAERTAAQGGGGGMEPPRYVGRYGRIRLAMAGSAMETVVVIGQRPLVQVAMPMYESKEAEDNLRSLAQIHSESLVIPIPDLPSTLLGGGSGSASRN